MRCLRAAIAVMVACGWLLGVLPIGKAPLARAAGADYVPETGHTLSGPIRGYWNARGGLWLFGYPISEPFAWQSETGEWVVAQYFERARLEYHPQLDRTEWRVLGGRLGVDLTLARHADAAFRATSAPSAGPLLDCSWFDATGHELCGAFKAWWEQEGGLATFGYPISEPITEGGYTVQYFERARFEYHPENAGSRWEVALGHLGWTDAEQRMLTDHPAFERVAAATTTTRVETTLRADDGAPLESVPAGSRIPLVGGPSLDDYLVDAGEWTGWARAGDLAWSAAPDPRAATPQPLATFDPALADQLAEATESASMAIWDPATNTLYRAGDSGPVAGASMAKVLLLAVSLLQSQRAGTAPSDSLLPMIEFSDNDAANAVWTEIGGTTGLEAFLVEYQLAGFIIPDPWDWGAIAAEADGWVRFFGLLGSGQLLDPAHTATALDLLHDVLGEHRWGVLTPGGDRLAIGKNGWFQDEDEDARWRVNSAGFLDVAEGPAGVAPLVVVVLTHYPGDWGESWGIDLTTRLTDTLAATAARRWSAGYLQSRTTLERAVTTRQELSRYAQGQLPVERSR